MDDFRQNAGIEEAIKNFYRQTNRKNLRGVLAAVYEGMLVDERWRIPVMVGRSMEGMIDPEKVKVGDTFTIEAEQRFSLQQLQTDDGRIWAVGYTSDEEYQKGPASDTLNMVIGDVLRGFVGEDCPGEGIAINPWGRCFLLTKELIKMIVDAEGSE